MSRAAESSSRAPANDRPAPMAARSKAARVTRPVCPVDRRPEPFATQEIRGFGAQRGIAASVPADLLSCEPAEAVPDDRQRMPRPSRSRHPLSCAAYSASGAGERGRRGGRCGRARRRGRCGRFGDSGSEAATDGLPLDDSGQVEACRGVHAVEHRAHGLRAVGADDVRRAVLGGSADDRDAADGGVALRELRHDRRQHFQHALREEGILIGGDGLGLGLDSGCTGLTLGADRLGLGVGAEATGLGFGLRLGAQSIRVTGRLRDRGGSLTVGARLVGLRLLLGDAGARLGLLDLLDRRRLGRPLTRVELGLRAGLRLVPLGVRDALDVGVELRLLVLGLLLQHGLLGLGAGELLGLLRLGTCAADAGVGVGGVRVERGLLDEVRLLVGDVLLVDRAVGVVCEISAA